MARKRPGPYVPLSVHYADDEAIMEAGEDAELMFLRMMAYAGRTPTTEGWVSRRVCLTRLGIMERPELGPEKGPESTPERRLERLTEVGLIIAERDGYQLAGWLRWNRSAEEMGLEREQDRKRKAALTREYPEKGPESDAETGPEPTPDSAPVPEGRSRSRSSTDTSSAAADALFDAFWFAYPKKVSKKTARVRWDQVIKRNEPAAIIAGAQAYARQVAGKLPEHIKNPDGWLNAERWNDEQVTTQRNGWSENSPEAMFN